MSPSIYEKTLSTGRISVSGLASNSVEQLFDIAERKNPKRSFLFVSKVLGRHIPVAPSVMKGTYHDLAMKMHGFVEPVLFIGMAETAVGLAAGVYREVSKSLEQSVLITTTRHPIEGELLCEFKENHSHATDHLIYWPANPLHKEWVQQANTIVLIDDEATTGNTFANLLNALISAGISHPKKVMTVTLTDWSGDALTQKVSMPVDSIALLKGSWNWDPVVGAQLPEMPNVNVTAKGSVDVAGQQCWGRLGMNRAHSSSFGDKITTHAGENILVLGSCEFVWLPFLLAERLEHQGANVKFSSVTRSPIAQGHAIQSIISFQDNYGLNIPNFVYNVAHQKFDRILLCVETAKDTVDNALLEQLSLVAPIVEVITHD